MILKFFPTWSIRMRKQSMKSRGELGSSVSLCSWILVWINFRNSSIWAKTVCWWPGRRSISQGKMLYICEGEVHSTLQLCFSGNYDVRLAIIHLILESITQHSTSKSWVCHMKTNGTLNLEDIQLLTWPRGLLPNFIIPDKMLRRWRNSLSS